MPTIRFLDCQSQKKILFDNPNMLYAFGRHNEGTTRESFFASQVSEGHILTMPVKGDFYIDNKYTIEVGGKKKSFNQIKDCADSFIAAADTEIGIGAKIPLWLFGFLY